MAAVEGIQMESPIALPGFQQRCAAAFAIACGGLQPGLALDALHPLTGQAVVDHIDHTPDGAAAVEERRRAPQHFDAVYRQDLDRHRVVGTERRGIGGRATVVEDADAVAVQPSDHRTAGVGSKVAATDTGQAVETLTQTGLTTLLQVLAAHHTD